MANVDLLSHMLPDQILGIRSRNPYLGFTNMSGGHHVLYDAWLNTNFTIFKINLTRQYDARLFERHFPDDYQKIQNARTFRDILLPGPPMVKADNSYLFLSAQGMRYPIGRGLRYQTLRYSAKRYAAKTIR